MQKDPPDHIEVSAAPANKPVKKSPDKRLFRRPVTPGKVAVYALLAVLAAALVIAARFIYVTVIDARAAFPDTPVQTAITTASPQPQTSAEATKEPEPTLSPEELLAMQADRDFMKDRVNILLTGIDYADERAGRNDFRTDTIMLFSVNFSAGDVDILSVPRDSYADIAFTDRKWKINGAYMSAGGADGRGYECLTKTVSTCLGGIPVDYYVAIEMPAVKDIVDIIGGVWYDVDCEINMNGRHLDKGYQLLNGQAVLDYCRARKGITSGTDIDRIDRQQRLLMEVFSQVKNASLLTEIPQIYNTLKDQIDTNLSFEQIAALAFFALDLDLASDLNRHTLKGEYMQAYNATYYVLDHSVTANIIRQIFGIDIGSTIDWTYSIEFVKNDNAKIALTAAITKVEDYLAQRRDTLSPELIMQTEALLSASYQTLEAANTDEMTDATALLNNMYATLFGYVPPTPTPAPTAEPTPVPTTAPTPTPEETAEPKETPEP